MQRHSCGSKVAMMVGLYLYSVVVGLLRHLLIATTQLSELEGASTDAQSPSVTLLLLQAIGGCSHITSAKIRGSWTPPPPSVSNGQHLAYPPSPPRQQWSAFGLPPLPPSSAFVSICPMPLLYYNFFTLTCLHDKMENFHLLGSNLHVIWLCLS